MRKFKTFFILSVIAGVFFSLVGCNVSDTPERARTPEELLSVSSDDYHKGSSNAKVTLIEYLDFECGACGAYYPVVKDMVSEFPNDLQVITRYFPLSGHKNGLSSALAVEAAARQDKFWQMHDLLFEQQRSWSGRKTSSPKIFEAYAEELGLDLKTFKSDVQSKSVKQRVERDRQAARQLNLPGTPTFFLNGKMIQNPKDADAFRALIKAAM